MPLPLPSLWIQMRVTDVALCSRGDGDEQGQAHHSGRHSNTDLFFNAIMLCPTWVCSTHQPQWNGPHSSEWAETSWGSHLSSGRAREVQPPVGRTAPSSHWEGLRKCLGCSSSSLNIKTDFISSVSPCQASCMYKYYHFFFHLECITWKKHAWSLCRDTGEAGAESFPHTSSASRKRRNIRWALLGCL